MTRFQIWSFSVPLDTGMEWQDPCVENFEMFTSCIGCPPYSPIYLVLRLALFEFFWTYPCELQVYDNAGWIDKTAELSAEN